MRLRFLAADTATADVTEATTNALQEVMEAVTDLPQSADEIGSYFSGLFNIIAEYAVTYGGRLVLAVLLLLIGFRLIKVLNHKISKSGALNKIESSTKNFMFKVLDVAAKIFLVILAASIMGVPMASVVAVIGSAGLAIGLALEGSLGNIASGVVLMITKPFKEGDVITVGGDSGTVYDIGIFYTTITTPDNRRIVYPNSSIANATLVNNSAESKRRVDLTFGTSYNADVNVVKNTIGKVLANHELVKKDPEPFVRLSKHGDSALEFTVRAWCETANYWAVYFDLLEQVKAEFDANGIEIPYPQMDVHIKDNKQ